MAHETGSSRPALATSPPIGRLPPAGKHAYAQRLDVRQQALAGWLALASRRWQALAGRRWLAGAGWQALAGRCSGGWQVLGRRAGRGAAGARRLARAGAQRLDVRRPDGGAAKWLIYWD